MWEVQRPLKQTTFPNESSCRFLSAPSVVFTQVSASFSKYLRNVPFPQSVCNSYFLLSHGNIPRVSKERFAFASSSVKQWLTFMVVLVYMLEKRTWNYFTFSKIYRPMLHSVST